MPPLRNPRHERFVQELVKGQSARHAYRLAGYTSDASNNQRLKNMPSVMQRYDELTQAVAQRTEVTAAKVMAEVATIAFADIDHILAPDADDRPRPGRAGRPGVKAAPVATPPKRGARLKVADKLEALNMLARMVGLYRERVEVTTQEAPERLSDFEAAKTIAFILQKAHVERGGTGEPTLESFTQASADGAER